MVMGGTVSVDTFFIISSVLLSYNFFQEVEKRSKINIFHMYLYRYIRITPPLIIVAAGYATVLKHFGSGPKWCIVPTWYVTDDMLYFYFSPILLIPLWKSPILGKLNWLLFYMLSLFVSFWTSCNGPGVLSQTLHRSPYKSTALYPWLVAWLLSLQDQKSPSKNQRYGGFRGMDFCHIFCMFSRINRTHVPFGRLRLQQDVFVLVSLLQQIGVVNLILSLPMFRVLGRLTYSISLIHFGFQSAMMAAGKSPTHFSNFVVVSTTLLETTLSSRLYFNIRLQLSLVLI
nr:unnamed protein product [Callosobruchus analis]